jgi:hypothetical protein
MKRRGYCVATVVEVELQTDTWDLSLWRKEEENHCCLLLGCFGGEKKAQGCGLFCCSSMEDSEKGQDVVS